MTYGESNGNAVKSYAYEKNIPIVDLRSDTISKPSLAMRQAMYDAEVGDDVYGEDPTVAKLEQVAAALVGKEAALFVTSGTMGNLIAIMNHCDVRGSETYCGRDSHIFLHEQGGAAQLAGVTLCTIPNNPDGTFEISALEEQLRSDRLHEPISKLVAIENTFNGKIVPQVWINELSIFCKKHDLKLHMDGARLWNAAVGSNVSAKDIVAPCESVTFCLSKGLGAPGGSLLCGSKAFIEKARRTRKALGGGMRQIGILAAAGLVALKQTVPILKDDHRRAYLIAEAINSLHSDVFTVDLSTTQTNMVLVNVNSTRITAYNFTARLGAVLDDVKDDTVLIRCFAMSNNLARFVLYYEVSDELVDMAIRKICHVIKQFESKLPSSTYTNGNHTNGV